METTNKISEEIDARITLIDELWEKKERERAISECKSLIEQAHNNGLYEKEMKAYNMLGSLYRGKGDYQEALNQFSEAMSVAKEHKLEMSEENAAALLCRHTIVQRISTAPAGSHPAGEGHQHSQQHCTR